MKKPILALAALLFSLSALAGEAEVRKALEAKFPGKVEAVGKTPFPGLYEAVVAGDAIYTDEGVNYLVAGTLVDGKSLRNLTQESMSRHYAQQFAKLPFELAAKTVKGNGKRTMVTFEDPNCGYCKRLAREISKLDNVTVYTFLLPVLGPDSQEKSRNIWCATNRSKVWMDWMLDAKPIAKSDCKWPAERMAALGEKFRINGTPAILFANGELNPGYLPADQLEQKLAKLGK